MVSAKRYWADGRPVAGQQSDYGFDDNGNRKTAGGRESAERTYMVNDLNQYVDWSVPNVLHVFGLANPTADRTKPIPQLGGRGSCRALTSGPQGRTLRVGKENQGSAGASPSRARVVHDAAGNLTRGARCDDAWHGENRLVTMRSRADCSASKRRLEFEYDWRGWRIRKAEYDDRDAGEAVDLSDTVFLYDLSAGQAGGWTQLGLYVWRMHDGCPRRASIEDKAP